MKNMWRLLLVWSGRCPVASFSAAQEPGAVPLPTVTGPIAVMFEVNLYDAPPDELCSMQAAAERSADMARFRATSGDFRKHGCKKKCIGVAYQSDRSRGLMTEFLFQTLSRSHPRESATQNYDLLCERGHLEARCWLGA